MEKFFSRLILAALLTLAGAAAGARPFTAVAQVAQVTDDPVKVQMYQRFVDNRLPNPSVAYQAAKDYLQRYEKDKDQYVAYLQKWVMYYERDERKQNLSALLNQKNFAEAYAVGGQILTEEPTYLRARIDLGYAGYLAASSKNEAYNSVALKYAKEAINAIERGEKPTEWAPFKSKDDTLAYLNYAVGFLSLKTNPDQAIDALIKAVQYDSDIRQTPSAYYFLAVAYQAGPYKTLSAAYQTAYAGKPETPESKAALDKLNNVIDHIIDAYARAIAAAGTDPKSASSRNEWLAQLTNFYKFRHDGSDAGLTDFIANVSKQPLPPKP